MVLIGINKILTTECLSLWSLIVTNFLLIYRYLNGTKGYIFLLINSQNVNFGERTKTLPIIWEVFFYFQLSLVIEISN